MFYNAKALIFERAKQMRSDMTPAEQAVWEFLKGKKILSLFKEKLNNYAQNDKRSSKVPFRGFRGEKGWQSWKAATRNPLEALRYV